MDIKCNPKFDALVEVLQNKISQNGVSKESEERLAMSRKNLDEKRRRFLKSKVLYNIICDISMDPGCSMQAEIAENLTLAEISSSLEMGSSTEGNPNSPGNKITTLALQSEDITRPARNLQIDKVLKQNIETRLFDYIKDLYLITNKDTDTELKASLLHPHLLRLHDKISDIVTSVKESSNEMKVLDANVDEALRKQGALLTKMESGFDRLINKHYTSSKLQSTSVQVQYMRAKCETLRLKIKSLEMEVINTTYNKEAIKAIKLVRTRLLEKIQRTEAELSTLGNRISQYRGISSEFGDLVKEYAKVLKKIEEKKWALRELNSTPGSL